MLSARENGENSQVVEYLLTKVCVWTFLDEFYEYVISVIRNILKLHWNDNTNQENIMITLIKFKITLKIPIEATK